MTTGRKAAARDAGIAAAFTLAIVALVLVSNAPPAAGASQLVRAAYAPDGFESSSPLYAGRVYDLILHDLPPSGNGTGYGDGASYALHDPAGDLVMASSHVGGDPLHPGREEVRFPGATFAVDGAWTLRGGAIDPTPLHVEPAPPAVAATATYRGAQATFRLSTQLDPWVAYDLMFTNLPPSSRGYGYGSGPGTGGGGYVLVDPDGHPFGDAVAGTPDGAHADRENASFAGVVFPREGEWGLRHPGGSRVPFHVGPAPTPTFAAPHVRFLPMLPTTADLAARDLDDFGRATLTIRYDAGSMTLRAEPGNVPGATLVASYPEPGVLRITVETTKPDVAGDFVLARLRMQSTTPTGGSALDLEVVAHEKLDGTPLASTAWDGSFATLPRLV